MTNADGPIRMCVGCRTRRTSDRLQRLSLRDDELVLGLTEGRGAWLCPDISCFDLAVRRGAVARGLKSPVSQASLDRIRIAFVQHCADVGDCNAATGRSSTTTKG